MIVSDHGFSHSAFGVNLTAELIKAGLKASAASDDVVVASSGQTLLLHVRDRDPALIRRIIAFLQAQDWIGVLFTAGRRGEGTAPVEGTEPGTFALELIHLGQAERAPDIVVTFPWSSALGPNGIPGTEMPSFAIALTETMAWQTAAYVRSLGRARGRSLPGSVEHGAALYDATAAAVATSCGAAATRSVRS